MRLAAVRVFVEDLAEARRFYAEVLGLPFAWEAAGAVGFDAGAILILEAADEEARREGLVGRFLGVSLEVADIAAVHAALSARGVAFLGPPERQGWGGTLAHLRDPSGNVLTLVG